MKLIDRYKNAVNIYTVVNYACTYHNIRLFYRSDIFKCSCDKWRFDYVPNVGDKCIILETKYIGNGGGFSISVCLVRSLDNKHVYIIVKDGIKNGIG